MSSKFHVIVVGGGAAGFFFAANLGEQRPDFRITLLERSGKLLEKVRISGGGRCNVCHTEYDPRQLVKAYPRGDKALRGPFHRFCSGDTVGWFEDRGVSIKTEDDGRMFPTTDNSESIVQALMFAAEQAGVQVRTRSTVVGLERIREKWQVHLAKGQSIMGDAVLFAPGSSPKLWEMFAELGHTIVPPVPSLFTFRCQDPRIHGLPGLSVDPAEVRVEGTKLKESGPVLITHWGFSGPAVLRTSAWGARELAQRSYNFTLRINWVAGQHNEGMQEALRALAEREGKRMVTKRSYFNLPLRLWQRLVEAAGIDEEKRWVEVGKKERNRLAEELTAGRFEVRGKSTFKEEFVTCGGISLKEVDFRTMESKILPGVYFAGEFLDVDAITGGFNFQAAWTTAWIAAQSLIVNIDVT